ncbi:hypothetical protein BC833DRAFT_575829 [Globomyces pollinis-pini]|nr:hypothetical protein BC833DRAFT_575829 [Globomyces pollinis-pini]
MNILIVASLLALQVLGQCTQPAVRREWRQLSPSEQSDYLDAVRLLKNRRPGGQDASTWNYDQFADCHNAYSPANHGTPMFFPWHRQFLNNYEKALQSVKPNLVVPYWDWTLDSQNPGGSVLFSPNAFGRNGNPSQGGCVTEGVAAGWTTSVGGSHCLRRCNSFSAFYPPAAVSGLISRSTSFASLASSVEGGPHGQIHNQVGGSCGDFTQMWSANDPIFFLHHGMVDKIWWRWQSQCSSFEKQFNSNPRSSMPPFRDTVSDMLDTQGGVLCYTYSRSAGDTPLQLSCPSGQLPAPGVNGEIQGKGSAVQSTTTSANAQPTATTSTESAASLSSPTVTNDTALDAEIFWLEKGIQGLLSNLDSSAVQFKSRKSVNKRGLLKEGQLQYLDPVSDTSSLPIEVTLLPSHTSTKEESYYLTSSIPAPSSVNIKPVSSDAASPSGYGQVPVTNTETIVQSTTQATYAAGLSPTSTTTAYVTATTPDVIMTFTPLPMVQRPLINLPLPTYTFNTTYKIEAPKVGDLNDQIHLRHPEYIPKTFIKNMMLDPYVVREVEVWMQHYIDDLNNRKGYVSPAALKNFDKYNCESKTQPKQPNY